MQTARKIKTRTAFSLMMKEAMANPLSRDWMTADKVNEICHLPDGALLRWRLTGRGIGPHQVTAISATYPVCRDGHLRYYLPSVLPFVAEILKTATRK